MKKIQFVSKFWVMYFTGEKNHKLFANFHSNSVHFYNTDDRENEIFVKNLTFDLKMEFGQSNNEITMRLSS